MAVKVSGAEADRVQAQTKIITIYGQEKIDAWRVQFCARCRHMIINGQACGLLPIETSGARCSYYDPV